LFLQEQIKDNNNNKQEVPLGYSFGLIFVSARTNKDIIINPLHASRWRCVCVFYCSAYYKAVRVRGGETMEDMCYERLRAEACVD
jgi:hypothetical protein